MILWWIGDIVLLAVVLPIVVYLLRGVLNAAKSIVPSVQEIAKTATGPDDKALADSIRRAAEALQNSKLPPEEKKK